MQSPAREPQFKCLPKMSTSHITTHVLLRGDVSELGVDHPTNDPRPFFKWTRQTRSFNTPPFARFESEVSPHIRSIPQQKMQSPAREPQFKCLPKMSTSHITTHVLLRGDVSELGVDHPTNDPRPFFKWTRQTRSFNTPPFARFESKVSLHNRSIQPQKRQSPAREPQIKCLPRMSTSHITTHVLLRGAVSELKADHPTNDPRPFFRWTRQTDRLTHHPSHDLNLQSRCTIHRFGQR